MNRDDQPRSPARFLAGVAALAMVAFGTYLIVKGLKGDAPSEPPLPNFAPDGPEVLQA